MEKIKVIDVSDLSYSSNRSIVFTFDEVNEILPLHINIFDYFDYLNYNQKDIYDIVLEKIKEFEEKQNLKIVFKKGTKKDIKEIIRFFKKNF